MGLTQSGFGGAALLLSTVLAFAGGPGECAAQAGADSVRERLSLGAAIAEARRSPFYAGTTTIPRHSGPRETRDRDGRPPVLSRYGSGPQEGPNGDNRPGLAIPLILATGWASHWATVGLLGDCLEGRYHPGCLLFSVLPMPAVVAAATLTGADWRRALGASAGGLAMGTAIYLVARLAGADNGPLLTLATGVVHAVLVIDGAG